MLGVTHCAVDGETEYDEEWLNRMWQAMWDQQDADWFLFDDARDGIHYVDPLEPQPKDSADTDPLDVGEWKLAEWPLPPSWASYADSPVDEVDRILAEDDDYRVPAAFGGGAAYPEWDGVAEYEPYRYQDYYVTSHLERECHFLYPLD